MYPPSVYPSPIPAQSITNPVGQHIANVAKQFWNHSSRHGPDEGNLACASEVNEMLQQAIGKTYGDDPTTVNSVRDDLLRQGGQIIPPGLAQPGDIAMTYNKASLQNIGGATAHMGMVIAPNTILANSSATRRVNQLFDFWAFSKLYPYFEIIRTPEALQNTPPSTANPFMSYSAPKTQLSTWA